MLATVRSFERAALGFALAASISLAAPAIAQEQCNAPVGFGITQPMGTPSMPGDTVRYQIVSQPISSASTPPGIVGGDTFTVKGFRVGLACENDGGLTGNACSSAPDKGVVEFAGNVVASGDCAGATVNVSFVDTDPVPSTMDEIVVLTLDPDFLNVQDAGDQCSIEFDVDVLGLSQDLSPGLIQAAGGFTVLDPEKSTCNNSQGPLTSEAQGTAQFQVTSEPCQVEIDKVCETCDPQTQESDVIVTVTNNGTGSCNMCAVTDTFDPGGANQLLPLTPDNPIDPSDFDLPPGASEVFRGTTPPLTGSTLDRADVMCQPAGIEGEIVEDFDEATCACGVNNYKCYEAKVVPGTDQFASAQVDLVDQFGETTAEALVVHQFCAPVDKNGEGREDEQSHLTCYKLGDVSSDPRPREDIPVRVFDQFFPEGDPGGEDLTARTPGELLCLPAVKSVVNTDPGDEPDQPVDDPGQLADIEGRINHFQCYEALGGNPPDEPPVGLLDQFSDPEFVEFVVGAAEHVCNPVDKNGQDTTPQAEGRDHLKCYDIGEQQSISPTEVVSTDQFGTLRLRLGDAVQLCESADKELVLNGGGGGGSSCGLLGLEAFAVLGLVQGARRLRRRAVRQ